MRVAIIPTGKLEWLAMSDACQRLFPQHEFYCVPSQEELATNRDMEFPIPGFTSCDVTKLQGLPNNADNLIQRAVAEVIGDQTKPADLAVIVDDLEIANLHQPKSVVSIVREAAARHLAELAYNARARDRHREALRSRVSFHILKPMVEGWLFADPQSLRHAGVNQKTLLAPNCDPECFETIDPAYLEDNASDCTCWNSLPEATPWQKKHKKDLRPEWLKTGVARHLHPKRYLCWLCKEPTEKTCTRYREAEGGAKALGEIDWAALLGNTEHSRYARSLVSDLADGLGEVNPFRGITAPETNAVATGPLRVLRNL